MPADKTIIPANQLPTDTAAQTAASEKNAPLSARASFFGVGDDAPKSIEDEFAMLAEYAPLTAALLEKVKVYFDKVRA